MSSRGMLIAALLVMGIAPATADAAPTVAATGDAGTPITLSPSAPTGIRQMDVSVGISVADDTQVLDGAGGAATSLSSCEDPGSLTGSPAYHGNGTYTVVVKYFDDANCATPTSKGKKRGRFHRVGKAKISKKGRFTKRLTIRHTGTYRLRYIYRGNSTVAAGRVTERIQITRHLFF